MSGIDACRGRLDGAASASQDDRASARTLLEVATTLVDLVDRMVPDLLQDEIEALRALLQRAHDAAGAEIVRRGSR